jgi:predicted ester cyclase
MDRNISYQRSVRIRRGQLPDFWDNFRRGILRSSLHWRGSTTTSFWPPLPRGRVLLQAEPEGKGRQMSLEGTREAVTKYLDSEHSDTSMMADDVVFTIMATGEEHRSPEGVSQMLNYFYHVAFDAHKEYRNQLFDDGIAFVEGDFVGEHIGEFAGIPPTNKHVRVPLGVVYELENDEIKRGRVYFEMPALFKQLGVEAS